MRRLLRDIAEGRNPGDATTLRDASVLAKLQQATAQDDQETAGTPETGSKPSPPKRPYCRGRNKNGRHDREWPTTGWHLSPAVPAA
jgi:hypothetical protein